MIQPLNYILEDGITFEIGDFEQLLNDDHYQGYAHNMIGDVFCLHSKGYKFITVASALAATRVYLEMVSTNHTLNIIDQRGVVLSMLDCISVDLIENPVNDTRFNMMVIAKTLDTINLISINIDYFIELL